jgi:CheY-like chemotaxis protein
MAKPALSILAIDDHPEILEFIRGALKSSGWTVAVAATPQDGLRLAKEMMPNVILCDAAMPKMSGPEVIRILKEDPATLQIPVVLITGAADADLFQHVPWTNYLAKPFTVEELKDAIYSASIKWGA